MKKSDILQELSNIYPSWSKVRYDDQSLGRQILNTMGLQLETMEKKIANIGLNQHITTANLDEIDLVYKVELDADYSFVEDNADPLFPTYIEPEVSGYLDSQWYPVRIAEFNDVESFWYTSVPDRVSLGEIVSGVDYELLTMEASELTITGLWEHHLDGGRLWVETTGGIEYIKLEGDNLTRAKVKIEGRTRKGTDEEETLIFPWDMKQPTRKEWKWIEKVSAYDMEDDVDIDIRSADFNNGPHRSFYNVKFSDNRNKIDEFWDLGHNGTIPTLDRIEYQTDEWQQLILGFSTKEVKERWELLDLSYNTISGIDLVLQPFSDRLWVITSDSKLLLYDLHDEMVSGVDDLRESTPGAHIAMDYDDMHVLLGEDIEFIPWHARPLKEMRSYRIWYQRPDKEKFGILNNTIVAYSSDFSVTLEPDTKLTRSVGLQVSIPTTMRGEYLVVFEATFVDDEVQEYRRIFSTKYKEPMAEISLSSILPSAPEGIEFDSDQKMWIRCSDDYYQINLHTDIMLIDYANKVLYFHEQYDEVGIDIDD